MSVDAYHEALNKVLYHVQQLTLDEQEKLLEDVASIVRSRVAKRPKLNIMEFRGAGKDAWQGVDVKKYIEEERNSWDG